MIRTRFLLFVLTGLFFLPCLAQTKQAAPSLRLLVKGKSPYNIRISTDATSIEKNAFLLFNDYFFNTCGTGLVPILENTAGKDTSIWLVSATRAKGFPYQVPWEKLGEDGFMIFSKGPTLIIAGGSGKGLLYGVAWFFDKYLGCRKYGEQPAYFPAYQDLSLPTIDDLRVPAFAYRSNHVKDPDYGLWYGLNRHDELWGMYVHTFNKLIPPDEYFDKHPEYFSLMPGGRVADAQLCLSNPEVLKVVLENLGKRISREPEKRYWSVSQNDTYSPCGCEPCKKLDLQYGGPSGTMIWFVNQVADAFPDKVISTLAYQYTRSAPINITPRANVNIFLCSIECDRSRPLTEHPSGKAFVKDVEDWTKLTHNILLWDYIIQYRSMLSPFPNFPVLQPNIRFFEKMKIPMIFEQGPSVLGHSEFSELRALLVARLLWNPDVNTDSIISDFCHGFYGKAGPMVVNYIERMNRELKNSGEELGIYGLPDPSENGYLSATNMQAYADLFDKAEAATQHEPIFLERLRAARLPLQYASLEQAKILGLKPGGFFLSSEKGISSRKDLRTMLDTFVVRCRRNGIKNLHEMGNSPEEYKKNTLAFLNSSYQPNLVFNMPVKLDPPASNKYHNGEPGALTDGLCGLEDYHLNWLGWEGTDMNATIDMGKTQLVKKIAINFMQDNNAWIFMPMEVTFSISQDGKLYKPLKTITTKTDAHTPGYILEEFSHTFTAEKARFIRINARNSKICPLWHKGAGGNSWIFADEIRLK